MTFSHKRKILTLSLFIALSHSTIASQSVSDRLKDNGNSTQTLTQLQATKELSAIPDLSFKKTFERTVEDVKATDRAQKEHAEHQKTRKFLGIGPDYKPSWWDLPSFFIKTLFQPFIEDAPKVAEAVKQGIVKEGVTGYALSSAGKVATTIIENPFDSVVLASAVALGVADLGNYAPAVQTAGLVARKVKHGVLPLVNLSVDNAPKLLNLIIVSYNAAHASKLEQDSFTDFALNIASKSVKAVTEFVQSDAFWTMAKVGFYGATTYYILSSIPGADAQFTPVLGTQYQINQNSLVSGSPFKSIDLTNGAVATGWVNNAGNMVARIHFPNNATFVTGEFTVSSSPSSVTGAQLTPCLGSFSNGNWFMSWLQSTSVLDYSILNSAGGTVIAPTQVNAAGETFVQAPSCVGLGTRGYIGWANSTSGTYKDLFVTFGSDGSGLSSPVLLQQSSAVLAGSRVAGLADGNVYALYGGSSLQASEISPTGSIGAPTTITLSPSLAIIDPTGLVGGSGKDAILLGTSGNNLKGISITDLVPSSTQFTVYSKPAGFCCPSADGLTNGNALTAIQVSDTTGNPIVNGTLISSAGSALSPEITISGPTLNGLGGPQVTRLATGGAFVTMGDGSNIYGRQVSFTPSPTSTTAPSSTTSGPTGSSTGTPSITSTTGSPSGTSSTSAPSTTGTSAPSGTSTAGVPTTTGTQAPTTRPSSAASSVSPSSVIMGGILALASLLWG